MATKDQRLEFGKVPLEQFNLLLAGTSINSKTVISALRDHFVGGLSQKEAGLKHGVNLAQVSTRVKLLQAENERAAKLSKFYRPSASTRTQ